MLNRILFTFLLFVTTGFAENRTFAVDGTTRDYIIEVPGTYTGTVPHSLVLVYHGMTGTAANTRRMGVHAGGAQDEFITVYPQGLNDIENIFSPGTFTTGWKFDMVNNRDVTFTTALLDSLEKEFSIKVDGIFVTGISNGGYMTDILGCNIGNRLGAIAPVIGGYAWLNSALCAVSKKLPVMHLGSAHDGIVDIEHLRTATDFWKIHNGISAAAVQDGICDVYTGIDAGAVVRHCEFICLTGGSPATAKNNACHTVPTTGAGYSYNGMDLVLDFFRNHGLGPAASVTASFPAGAAFTSTVSIFPGPVTAGTPVTFHVNGQAHVTVDIFNSRGRLVRQGISSLWDGRDGRGRAVATGVYVVQVTVGEKMVYRRIAVTR